MSAPPSPYQPGQHWTHTLPLPDLRPLLFIWSQPVDDAFRIVLECTEAALAELHARGIICTVAAPILDTAGLRLADGETRPPDWLPEPTAESEPLLPEDRAPWTIHHEGTLEAILRAELAWLASLERAIQANFADRVAQILRVGPEALHGGEAGTALHLAIGCDRPAVAELLLRHGADLHARDAVGDTPLHLAALSGRPELVELLLAHGADVNARNHSGQTPLFLAVHNDDRQTTALLEQHGAAPDLNTLLRRGKLAEARAWLAQADGRASMAPDPAGLLGDLLAFLHGVQEGLPEVMAAALPLAKTLLDQGIDVNARFPLYAAVALQDASLARLLLEHGADPNQGVEHGTFLLPTPACGHAMRALLRQYGAQSPDDPDRVLPQTSEILRENPLDTNARRQRAEAWIAVGQYPHAVADLDTVLRQRPRDKEAQLLRIWLWIACPDATFRDGAQGLREAQQLARAWIAGIGWEEDGSNESWTLTEREEALAAALAEQGQLEEALAVLDEIEESKAHPRSQERIERMRACFQAGQPYRLGPVSTERMELGQRLAELAHIGVVDEPEPEPEPPLVLTIDAAGTLAVRRSNLGVEGIRRLLAEPRLAEVVALTIDFSDLGDDEALLLAEGLRTPRLTRLDLSNNAIRDAAGARLLAQANWPELTELDLRSNRLGRRTAQALAANPCFARLTHLSLSANRIRTAGAAALAEAAPLANLTALMLAANVIRDEGLCRLAASPYLTRLTTLDLAHNRLTARGLAALAQAPTFAQLTRLELNDNRLDDAAALALAASPYLRSLDALFLWHNRIGPAGAQALAASPVLDSVTGLLLDENPIGSAGAAALAQSAHLSRLTDLSLTSCSLDAGAAVALAESPYLEPIRSLSVTGDEVGKEGRQALRRRFGDRVRV